jgi:hypothetical protein
MLHTVTHHREYHRHRETRLVLNRAMVVHAWSVYGRVVEVNEPCYVHCAHEDVLRIKVVFVPRSHRFSSLQNMQRRVPPRVYA